MRKTFALALLAAVTMVGSASADIIISEYVEGSSNNKAIELFNTGASDIDLSDISVNRYSNGGSTAATVISLGSLTGTLSPGDVFVIANPSLSLTGAVVDATSGNANWNGDDAVELLLNSETVDVVGQIGFDPGTEWGSGSQSTANNTLTRNINILSGDNNGADAFDPSAEWRGGDQDSHTLGTHDGNFSAVPEPSSIAVLGLVSLVGIARRRR